MNVVTHKVAGVSQPQPKDPAEELLTRLIHRMARSTGAFRSTTQALLNGADEDPVLRRELLQDMEFELGELQRMLENVTQFKALERGSFHLSLRDVVTSAWLRQLLSRWQRAMPDKLLEWVVDIPEGLPLLRVDVDKLEQSFNNLLGNAVKHSPVGARITVQALSADGYLRLRVASSRPRLLPADYDRLAELFYTGEIQGRFPTGVGVGLYVTRQMIEQHGGTLEISRPTPDDDAVGFEVALPITLNSNGFAPNMLYSPDKATSNPKQ